MGLSPFPQGDTKNFTFHSGYILMYSRPETYEVLVNLYIPFWIYSNTFNNKTINAYLPLHSILDIF